MWAGLKGRPREIQTASGDADTTTRVLYTLDALPETSPLWQLLDLWRDRSACSPSGLASVADIAPYPSLSEDCHLIDVSPANPWGFRILSYGLRSAASRGTNYTGLHLGEIPSLLHSSGLQVDYNTSRMLGVPRLQAITTRYDHRSRSYVRLILPLTQCGAAIDRLLVGVAIGEEQDHYSALTSPAFRLPLRRP